MTERTAKTREMDIKLDILESLARSQKALARMIESMADIADHDESLGRELRRNAEAISRYQMVLADKLAGIKTARVFKGKPGKPWVNAKAGISGKR